MSQKQISAYMAKIGSKGGKKSRRKMSQEEAKRIAAIRWDKASGHKEEQSK